MQGRNCVPRFAPAKAARLESRLRAKTKLSNDLNLISPVQSRARKYIALLIPQNSGVLSLPRAPYEGRFAIVTDVGRGMRWTRMAHQTNAREAYGEVVWS